MKSAPQSIRVLCVDDHPLVRKGIAAILANEPDMELVAEAGDGREAVEAFRLHRPDVTLMDLRMRNMDGLEATRLIRRETPDARIIALTSYDGDQEIHRSLEAGVRGYVLKETVHTEIVRAIRPPRAMARRAIPRLNKETSHQCFHKRPLLRSCPGSAASTAAYHLTGAVWWAGGRPVEFARSKKKTATDRGSTCCFCRL